MLITRMRDRQDTQKTTHILENLKVAVKVDVIIMKVNGSLRFIYTVLYLLVNYPALG